MVHGAALAADAPLYGRAREAFALRRIEQLSLDDTASITGAAVSTVGDRVKRAVLKLRGWLEDGKR